MARSGSGVKAGVDVFMPLDPLVVFQAGSSPAISHAMLFIVTHSASPLIPLVESRACLRHQLGDHLGMILGSPDVWAYF